MFILIYRSEANLTLDLFDLQQIHGEALFFNDKNSITGCLFHHKGKFIQLLEGPKRKVLRTYAKIKTDSRHNNLIILSTKNSTERIFPKWNMIFNNIDIDGDDESYYKIKYFQNIYSSLETDYISKTTKENLWKEVNKILNPEVYKELNYKF